jgi:hypothetical protein
MPFLSRAVVWILDINPGSRFFSIPDPDFFHPGSLIQNKKLIQDPDQGRKHSTGSRIRIRITVREAIKSTPSGKNGTNSLLLNFLEAVFYFYFGIKITKHFLFFLLAIKLYTQYIQNPFSFIKIRFIPYFFHLYAEKGK